MWKVMRICDELDAEEDELVSPEDLERLFERLQGMAVPADEEERGALQGLTCGEMAKRMAILGRGRVNQFYAQLFEQHPAGTVVDGSGERQYHGVVHACNRFGSRARDHEEHLVLVQLALSHACDKLGKAADHRKLLIEHAMEHAAGTLLQRGEAHVDHQRLVHEAVLHATSCLDRASVKGHQKLMAQLATEHACASLGHASEDWFRRHLRVDELGELFCWLRGEPHTEGKYLREVEALIRLDVDHLVVELAHDHHNDHKAALEWIRQGLWGELEAEHTRTQKEQAAWRALHALAHDTLSEEHDEPGDEEMFLTPAEVQLLLERLGGKPEGGAGWPQEVLEVLSHFTLDQLTAKLVALPPKHHHHKGFKRLLKRHVYSQLGLETLKKETKKQMEKFTRRWRAIHQPLVAGPLGELDHE